jgi:hypothetical protein
MWRTMITPFAVAAVYGVIAGAFHFLGGAIDQPHPEYTEGNWITHRVPDSLRWSEVIAVVMFALVSVDLAVQNLGAHAGAKDFAFFPKVHRLRDFLNCDVSRWLLISGFAFLALVTVHAPA